MGGLALTSISIPLTRGFRALVSPEDADLAELGWYAVDRDDSHYAMRRGVGPNGNPGYLHSLIAERMGLKGPAAGCVIDHRDGDGLNNQRANLRSVTHQRNRANLVHVPSNSTTGVLGVGRKRGRFRAYITKDGHQFSLGTFDTIEAATDARKAAELRLYGELAAVWRT